MYNTKPRKAIKCNGYYKIPLASGEYALIDIQDLPLVNICKWHLNSGYATRTTSREHKTIVIRMHHVIMGNPLKGLEVDHINRNRLDNRRSNLRIVTRSENQQNASVRKDNKTGHKGINFVNHYNGFTGYIARIQHNNKRVHLGYFHTLNEAVKAKKAYERKIENDKA